MLTSFITYTSHIYDEMKRAFHLLSNVITFPFWFLFAVTCNGWKRLKDISAEEKLIALGYKSKYGPQFGRLHQFAKLFMFSPSSGLFSCPLAMTDGAAKSIKARSRCQCQLPKKYDTFPYKICLEFFHLQ